MWLFLSRVLSNKTTVVIIVVSGVQGDSLVNYQPWGGGANPRISRAAEAQVSLGTLFVAGLRSGGQSCGPLPCGGRANTR